MRVFVLDKHKKPLMPCSPKRARFLLEQGRAVVHKHYPFTIRLKDRIREESALQPVVLKLDPGSKTTGIALARETVSVELPIDSCEQEHDRVGVAQHALHLSELTHRGRVVHKLIVSRSSYRRGRRGRKLRYRTPRFDNRTRMENWMPPSLQSRVGNIRSWVVRFGMLAPVMRVDAEEVRFDTQLLQKPDISGMEYQQGELAGYEVREYLLHNWGRRCAYCGTTGAPLQIEHSIPRSRGGSNRVSNLTLACEGCNQHKGNRSAEEFGYPDIQKKAQLSLRDAAAVNTTRYAIVRAIRSLGLPVTTWSGGRTKYNRTRFRLPKTHCLDALCVGLLASVHTDGNSDVLPVLAIRAMGRGQRLRTRFDKYGFPRGYLTRQKRVFGFATGDLVRATLPGGKHRGTHVGRVAVRAGGSFRVGERDGIRYRHCCLLARGDGYEYTSTNTIARAYV